MMELPDGNNAILLPESESMKEAGIVPLASAGKGNRVWN